MNLCYAWVLALAGACGVVPWAHATEPLRLQEAVSRALGANPALAAEAAQLDAVRARAEREGLAPQYFVTGELENVGGTGSLSGVNSAESTLRIGRLIELGGKRAARQALGAAEIDQQQTAADATRIELTSRTAARFIEVAVDQQRLDFANERVRQAERTRREVAGWVWAARNPESDLRAAEIVVANAELDREHAEHELSSARTTLAATWGDTIPDFDTVAADLTDLPEVEPLDTLLARLPNTIDQQAFSREARLAEARRRIAEAARKPDLNFNVGVRRLEGPSDQGLVMSVSVPLGSRTRAGYSIAEADAQLAAIEARRKAEQFERHQLVFEKYQELGHARTEVESLRGRVVPKAEQALAFTRRGFEAGRFSFLSLSQAQTTLFELRERLVEAYARYHTLLVELDRLTATTQDTFP
ncbi:MULTISPECIES: TolC family protein [Pseudoxanthomonas]|uniref:TolC family protein n=1 Tax=Pseudoxanthomonas TaxID=83618 RepID=UPI0009D66500|nr:MULTISPECIES: TolC family protein [Pseudoxanthomonas]MCH2093374.1 TolC family protein [Pseudoxanthomonas sp.]